MSTLWDVCECGVCEACRSLANELLCDALCESQELCTESGDIGTFIVRDEGDVKRDQFKSIKAYLDASTKTFDICISDINYSPSQQTLEKSGLYENAEVAVKTPTKCWFDNMITFKDIDIKRTTVLFGEETFKIKEKGREQVVAGTVPLFYTFGLVKN